MVIVFGYIAILAFIVGVAYRIWNWARLPTGFSWGLFPKPTRWTVTSLIWKAFAWPTLLKADKWLWIAALCFHLGMLVLFLGHLGVFVDMASFGEGVGIPAEASYTVGIVAGSIAGIVILFYVFRRLFITRTKEISSFADHFWLWALLVVVGVGIYARVFHEVSSDAVREFAVSVVTLRPILPPENSWFLLHTLLSEFFIIYAVMGKPIHFVGQLFTQYILVTKEEVA